jgi:tetratricopeptide (TPR) repeat protein
VGSPHVRFPIPDRVLPPDAPVARLFRATTVTTFHQALAYVRGLLYARPSNPDQLALVLAEGRGTCSSKHRLLALLAHELGITDLILTEGLIRFEAGQNAPLAQLLAAHGLPYLPEAHLYFRYAGERLDLTSNRLNLDFERVLLSERAVDPARIFKERAIATFEKLGTMPFVAMCRQHLANLELQTGNVDKAITIAQKALVEGEAMNSHRLAAGRCAAGSAVAARRRAGRVRGRG